VKLNLGSGKDWRKDCINADIQPEKKPDWVLDITQVPWGEVIDTRLGKFPVEKGMFSEIIANDVLEHIPDLVSAMTNCRDLLKRGGEMHIHVPYDLSLGAWQDPTHVRALFGLVLGFESCAEGFEFLEVFAVLRDFGCPAFELERGWRGSAFFVFKRVTCAESLGCFAVDELGAVVLVAC